MGQPYDILEAPLISVFFIYRSSKWSLFLGGFRQKILYVFLISSLRTSHRRLPHSPRLNHPNDICDEEFKLMAFSA